MPKKPKGRPTKAVEVAATPKLLAYLDRLVEMEGYGNSRAEVARGFVWKEVNRLLEVKLLSPSGASSSQTEAEESEAEP